MKTIILFLTTVYFVISSIGFAQISSNLIHVQISGKGKQAIVFIPGFASSGDVWNETKKLFENNYTCYVLTMPGFAGVPADSIATIDGWKQQIAKYIEDKKIKQSIIIGHSMGGLLAMDIASDYPDLIRKIIVVDALPCLSALSNPAFKHKEGNDCAGIINQFKAISNDQFYKMQKGGISQLLMDTAHREQVIDWSMKSDRKTFASIYCDFSNTDLREKISAIKCPALILLEPYFKNIESTIKDQYRNLKTARILYANKGLHFIMYDDTAFYQEQLKAFIDN